MSAGDFTEWQKKARSRYGKEGLAIAALFDESTNRSKLRLVSAKSTWRIQQIVMEANLRNGSPVILVERELDSPLYCMDASLVSVSLGYSHAWTNLSQKFQIRRVCRFVGMEEPLVDEIVTQSRNPGPERLGSHIGKQADAVLASRFIQNHNLVNRCNITRVFGRSTHKFVMVTVIDSAPRWRHPVRSCPTVATPTPLNRWLDNPSQICLGSTLKQLFLTIANSTVARTANLTETKVIHESPKCVIDDMIAFALAKINDGGAVDAGCFGLSQWESSLGLQGSGNAGRGLEMDSVSRVKVRGETYESSLPVQRSDAMQ